MSRAHSANADSLDEQAGIWCARLAEGDMPLDQQREFDLWLDAGPEHRDAFDRATRIWHAIEVVGATPDLIRSRCRALDSARSANRHRWRRDYRFDRSIVAIAACLLICVTLGGAWFRYVPRVYDTDVGERRVVSLSDGSAVSLDASTRLEVRYLGDRRELWLKRGRVRFAVAKDRARPFSVVAGNRRIIATGTEFSVELLPREVRVVLLEGRVAVQEAAGEAADPIRLATPRQDASGDRADQVLTPGHELTASLDAPIARVVSIDTVSALSWEAGQLVFIDEPLSLAVERVNRYSSEKLAIDPSVGTDVLVNGVFVAGNTAGFADGMTTVAPVRLVERDGVRTFVRR